MSTGAANPGILSSFPTQVVCKSQARATKGEQIILANVHVKVVAFKCCGVKRNSVENDDQASVLRALYLSESTWCAGDHL